MANNPMTPELQKTLMEYENTEKQLQVIVLQKHQMQLQLNEINLAGEEIKKAVGDVFKSVGAIMVKSTRSEAEADLKERKEVLNMRLSSLAKQEEKLREHLTIIQKSLQNAMKPAAGAGGRQ